MITFNESNATRRFIDDMATELVDDHISNMENQRWDIFIEVSQQDPILRWGKND